MRNILIALLPAVLVLTGIAWVFLLVGAAVGRALPGFSPFLDTLVVLLG